MMGKPQVVVRAQRQQRPAVHHDARVLSAVNHPQRPLQPRRDAAPAILAKQIVRPHGLRLVGVIQGVNAVPSVSHVRTRTRTRTRIRTRTRPFGYAYVYAYVYEYGRVSAERKSAGLRSLSVCPAASPRSRHAIATTGHVQGAHRVRLPELRCATDPLARSLSGLPGVEYSGRGARSGGTKEFRARRASRRGAGARTDHGGDPG